MGAYSPIGVGRSPVNGKPDLPQSFGGRERPEVGPAEAGQLADRTPVAKATVCIDQPVLLVAPEASA